ncbi:MAG TPA: hypothetical protein V6C57_02405, partial [Coleofasciculaceae cyanobacterium]
AIPRVNTSLKKHDAGDSVGIGERSPFNPYSSTYDRGFPTSEPGRWGCDRQMALSELEHLPLQRNASRTELKTLTFELQTATSEQQS